MSRSEAIKEAGEDFACNTLQHTSQCEKTNERIRLELKLRGADAFLMKENEDLKRKLAEQMKKTDEEFQEKLMWKVKAIFNMHRVEQLTISASGEGGQVNSAGSGTSEMKAIETRILQLEHIIKYQSSLLEANEKCIKDLDDMTRLLERNVKLLEEENKEIGELADSLLKDKRSLEDSQKKRQMKWANVGSVIVDLLGEDLTDFDESGTKREHATPRKRVKKAESANTSTSTSIEKRESAN